MTLTSPADAYLGQGVPGLPLPFQAAALTLTANVQLDAQDEHVLRVNGGAADRTITLDDRADLPAAGRGNLPRWISNVGATNNLIVNDDLGAPVTTLLPGQGAFLLGGSAGWSLIQTWTADSSALIADTISEETAGAGVTVDGTLIKDGGAVLRDSVTRIHDNGDPTKQLAFEVSGIAAGQTRTLTMPDSNVNLGDMAKIASGTATILLGASTVVVALGAAFDGKPALAGIQQAAADATLTSILHTSWDGAGNLTITGNAASTAAVTVSYIVDGR